MKEEKSTKDDLLETTLNLFKLINELAGSKIKHAPRRYIQLKLENLFLLTKHLELNTLYYFKKEFPDFFPEK